MKKILSIKLITVFAVCSFAAKSHAIEWLVDPADKVGYKVGDQVFMPAVHLNDVFYKNFSQYSGANFFESSLFF